jgi:hypothetical protein
MRRHCGPLCALHLIVPLVCGVAMGHDRCVLRADFLKPTRPSRRGRFSPSVRVLVYLGLFPGLTACESEPVAAVHLTVGVQPEDQRSFVPKASLAEYTEIPGLGTELRVVLSSHPITCDSYLPLVKDQIIVALDFSVPTGTNLGSGVYPWNEPKTGGGDSPEAPAAMVTPYVRLGKHGIELPRGGQVELTELRLDAQGAVRGILRLEQPGAAGLPATSLLGSFSARWCRIATMAGIGGP